MPTVRLLGPIDVIDDHGVVHTPGSPLRCTLLALLALQPCTAIDTEALLDRVWDGRPPASGLRALRFHISRLRCELGISDLIVTVGSAYRLDADSDLAALCSGLAADTDARTLGALLATRRGDPFLGSSGCSVLDHERRRLDELTVAITERLYKCGLAEGDTSVIGDLTRLCLDHPVRESLWALLIRAHYQAGNQADALRAATALRINLREELGVDRRASFSNSNCRSSTTTYRTRHPPSAHLALTPPQRTPCTTRRLRRRCCLGVWATRRGRRAWVVSASWRFCTRRGQASRLGVGGWCWCRVSRGSARRVWWRSWPRRLRTRRLCTAGATRKAPLRTSRGRAS